MSKTTKIVILLIVVIAVGWGIGKYTAPSASREDGTNISTGTDLAGAPGTAPETTALPSAEPAPAVTDAPDHSAGAENTPEENPVPTDKPVATAKPVPTNKPAATASNNGSGGGDAEMVAAEPESIAVMVNKQYRLPDKYKPADLVYPDVPFIFSEKIEKRMLRLEAARALEEMFAGAKEEGVYLAGVSGYRSEATQKRLFNNYVARDGEAKARTYSAMPGHSEHQTGLAIDLSGSDGKCAAESCFAGTKEAEWLAAHAAEYGYIIRFPEGKQAITGYIYEPWHVRYVGKEIAASITERGITLEEYYDAVPVSK